jgi:streptogramin lyase
MSGVRSGEDTHLHLRRRTLGAATALVLTAAPLMLPAGTAQAAPGASRTYTLDADFDEGTANNVVHSTPHQLQLDDTVTAFPFIWVALSARGTIAKIDTVTGAVKGEYSTTSDGDSAHNPSRTSVANDGSVWAGNRNQSSVIHVGLVETDQCEDRNGNGTIETSTGYGDVLAWPGGSNGDTSAVSGALDECIRHYVDTQGSDARHLSINAHGDVWVGASQQHIFQKVDGVSGVIEPGSTKTLPCGGYGGLIDGNGVLWSALNTTALLRWDPDAADSLTNPRCLTVPSYGLAFDSHNNVWASTYNGTGLVHRVSPDGNTIASFNVHHPYAQGLAIDGNDHVWVSSALSQGPNRIAHLKNDGTYVGEVTGSGSGSTGVSVDAAGKIWTANIDSSDATRIDPAAGAVGADGVTPIGTFDLTVALPGAAPYNYSDMTGSALTGKPTSGTWSVVYDSTIAGAEWGSVDWTAALPSDSKLAFTVASSDDGITFGPATATTDGADLTVANGRYLRVTAAFTRATTVGEESPILYDVTVTTADLNGVPVCTGAAASDAVLWPPNHKMVPITVNGLTDPDGDPLTVTVTGIRQDEVVNGPGDGNTAPDGTGVGTSTAKVRAERAGTPKAPGDGRVYHVSFSVADGQGGTCTGTAKVSVPHDQRGAAAVDGGPLYDSTV